MRGGWAACVAVFDRWGITEKSNFKPQNLQSYRPLTFSAMFTPGDKMAKLVGSEPISLLQLAGNEELEVPAEVVVVEELR